MVYDGLEEVEVRANTMRGVEISGTTIFGTSLVESPLVNAMVLSNDQGYLYSVSIGSGTSTFGAQIQAGSGILSPGSTTTIVYPRNYSGIPHVFLTNTKTLGALAASIIGTGSVVVIGQTATDTFNWCSVGI
jgi:hypothetical protein